MGSCASKTSSINLPNEDLAIMKERKSVSSPFSSPEHTSSSQTEANVLQAQEISPELNSSKRHHRHRFFQSQMRKMKPSKHSLAFSLKSSFKMSRESGSCEREQKSPCSSLLGDIPSRGASHNNSILFIESSPMTECSPNQQSTSSGDNPFVPLSRDNLSPNPFIPLASLSCGIDSSKGDNTINNNVTVRPLDLWTRSARYSRTGKDEESCQVGESQAASLKWPSDRYQHSRDQREAPYHRIRHSHVPSSFVQEDSTFVDLPSMKRFSNPLTDATPTVEAFKFHYGEETYREYKLQHLNYISRPRKCNDNYKQEIYDKWKRYSTCSTMSSGSDTTTNTKLPNSSITITNGCKLSLSNTTTITSTTTTSSSPPSASDSCCLNFPVGVISLTSGQNILVRKPLVLETIRCPPLLSPSSIASAQSAMNAAARSSSPPAVENKPSDHQPLPSQEIQSITCPTVDSPLLNEDDVMFQSMQQTTLSNASSISLNSGDLMLTTDVGLDAEDDDVGKDLYGSEKEDPFLVESADDCKHSIPTTQNSVDSSSDVVTPEDNKNQYIQSSNQQTPTTPTESNFPNAELDRGLLRRLRSLPRRKYLTEQRPISFSNSISPIHPTENSSTKPSKDQVDQVSECQLKSSRTITSSPHDTLKEEEIENSDQVADLLSSGKEEISLLHNQDLASIDPPIILFSSDCRQMLQEVSSMKLTLLKLRRMLLEDEGHMPTLRNSTRRIIQRRQTTGGENMPSEPVTPYLEQMTPLSPESIFPTINHDILTAQDAPAHEFLYEDLVKLKEMDYVTQLPQPKLQQLVCQMSAEMCILLNNNHEQENIIQLLQTQMTKYIQYGGKVCTPVNPSWPLASPLAPNGVIPVRTPGFHDGDVMNGYSPGPGVAHNYSPSSCRVARNETCHSYTTALPFPNDNQSTSNRNSQYFSDLLNERKSSLPRPSFLGLQQTGAVDPASSNQGLPHSEIPCTSVPS